MEPLKTTPSSMSAAGLRLRQWRPGCLRLQQDFGSATIGDFNVNTDTIEIDKSLFATVSALLQGAQSANSGHDTIITDAAHDKITLTGVTLAQLQAHPNDFHLI